jgi:CRISPR-associated endonuclease/helicase Cas3
LKQKNKRYVAHVRSADSSIQELADHLLEVSACAKKLAAKINAPEAGELIGLLHDLGKYSTSFQDYIQSGTGLIDPDSENFVNASDKKGKIDHSTAGAQWVFEALSEVGVNGEGKLCGQILALCIASHHSGLIDCLKPDCIKPEDINSFKKRIEKPDDHSHLAECKQNADVGILD